MQSETAMNVFFDVHSGLPRQGPGDNLSTRTALSLMTDLPSNPAILDVGCGPGMQTLELARNTAGHITAVDNHPPYLEELNRRANDEGLTARITTANMSMSALDFPDASFDAIWSEGAIYLMGFENGLRAWRRLLKPRGYVAVTELSWLRPDPPKEIRDYWEAAYPAMSTIEANLVFIRAAEYDEVGYFELPASSWWTHYYTPLDARLPALLEKYRDDAGALAILDAERIEINMFRKYSDWYGYVFYVMRLPQQTL